MGATFWIKRYVTVFSAAFVIIAGMHLARGRGWEHAWQEEALWAFATATVLVASRLYQSRRGQHCSICRDTPEMR